MAASELGRNRCSLSSIWTLSITSMINDGLAFSSPCRSLGALKEADDQVGTTDSGRTLMDQAITKPLDLPVQLGEHTHRGKGLPFTRAGAVVQPPFLCRFRRRARSRFRIDNGSLRTVVTPRPPLRRG